MAFTNRQIHLAARPKGLPKESDFALVTTEVPALQDGQFLVRINYVSVDPYMRGLMNEGRSYVNHFNVGDVVLGGAAGTVIDSRHPEYAAGETVLGFWGWQEYAVSDGGGVHRFDASLAPLSTSLGVLGMPQILDAVAVGQFTPGPVFTTATFIGYLLGGMGGAAAATAGIFLPSFVLVFALNPLIPRMRASKWLGALLDGVNAASLALMAAVSLKLGFSSLLDAVTIVLFLAALAALLKFKINSFWLILAGGLIGFLVKAVF